MARHLMTSILAKALMIVAGTLLGLATSEISTRLYYGETFRFRNFLIEDLDFLHCHRWPTIYDPSLGWIPKPNSKEPGNLWGMKILEEGFRSNGEGSLSDSDQSRKIIAVGDSFTFGDQVENHETWPAQLERKLGRSITNAGVYNYGIDQSIMRGQFLINRYHPKLLILSVYSEDLLRARLRISKGLAKPYFEPRGNELVLKNNPVPPPEPLVQRLGWAKGVLGYSYAMHQVMKHLFPETWYVGRGGDDLLPEENAEVPCRLLNDLHKQATAAGTKMMVLLQFSAGEIHDPFDKLLQCASDARIPVLDLYAPLSSVRDANRDEYESFFIGHMSAKGNAWVADQLAKFIQSEKLLD